MARRGGILLVIAVLAAAGPAGAWNLALTDTVPVDGTIARLADLVDGPVPAGVADLVVRSGGRPGTAVDVSRRDLLRRLVTAGAAAGVRFSGPAVTTIVFRGATLSSGQLQEAARRAVQALVPPAAAGAPATWFELAIAERDLAAGSDDWRVVTRRTNPLQPGRNPVRFELVDGQRSTAFTATVILHAYGEVATSRLEVERDAPLEPEQFSWTWRDLADLREPLVVGRAALAGASAAQRVKTGAFLRESDLKATPLVNAGDSVDLAIIRGGVAVTVRCLARQAGTLGQTIPVRNELTGRLVNARVAGPGLVEWRR